MRCDYPIGFDEDYLEPACEIFLQLFLQNAQIDGNEDLNQDNDDILNVDFGGYESDDNSSFPSIHTISDDSLSAGEFSGDEAEALIILNEESNLGVNIVESCTFSDILPQNEGSLNHENDSADVYKLIDEYSDNLSVNPQSREPSSTVNSQNSDDVSYAAFQETSADTTSSNLSLSNQTSSFEESSVQTNVLPNDIPPFPSALFSLYLGVPPTCSSHESDNLLSEVSSDKLISDVKSASTPSLDPSDNGSISSENESLHDVNKMCDNSKESASDNVTVCSSFCVTEKDKKHTKLDSELDTENSISSENIHCEENSHPEFAMCNVHLSEGMNVHEDGNADCDVNSDKPVSNLKRKVANSVDDDTINKVPKYSLSHESNDSANEVSLDTYCAELSNSAEMSVLCDDDEMDIMSSTDEPIDNIRVVARDIVVTTVTEPQTDL